MGAVIITLSNRASCRRRLPMSDMFADAEEAELTAATVEERLNFLHDQDALPHWRSVRMGIPLPGTGGRAPCGGQSEAAASCQHCTTPAHARRPVRDTGTRDT